MYRKPGKRISGKITEVLPQPPPEGDNAFAQVYAKRRYPFFRIYKALTIIELN
jgi:hypothetical protein